MAIGYLAAPTGITTALNYWGQRQAYSPAPGAIMSNFVFNPGATPTALIAAAGLVLADWNNLVTALGTANAANMLNLLNAAGLVIAV